MGTDNWTDFIALIKVSISPKSLISEDIVSVLPNLEKHIGVNGANTLYSPSSNWYLYENLINLFSKKFRVKLKESIKMSQQNLFVKDSHFGEN